MHFESKEVVERLDGPNLECVTEFSEDVCGVEPPDMPDYQVVNVQQEVYFLVLELVKARIGVGAFEAQASELAVQGAIPISTSLFEAVDGLLESEDAVVEIESTRYCRWVLLGKRAETSGYVHEDGLIQMSVEVCCMKVGVFEFVVTLSGAGHESAEAG